ncbi:uncharacterized protein LY89DRAFT_768223 [Mollisia scopiformis]|uniref:2EXR domain-containing protein n=1 Tax=Mollisia scopiformis TaxID=149040 RepID=A0A194XPG6_MOLSC|nr:uncharacterized protein LY89DRAFT_768223 [Mollisia scopiformis]KUJ21964.1 hypothetical protein LY89DRAFT_768223 [Mollisia scopiformis]
MATNAPQREPKDERPLVGAPLTEDELAPTSNPPHPIHDQLRSLSSSITSLSISEPCSTPRGDFEPFANLAIELRLAIWDIIATEPRLVHWRPGGGKQPTILAVNHESREVGLKNFTLCFDRYLRSGVYAIFVNIEIDTLYRKQMVPNLTRMRDAGAIPLPSTMGVDGPVGPNWNVRYWTKSLRRLCISIHEAFAVPKTPGRMPGGRGRQQQGIWPKLKAMCPDLEELIVAVPRIRHESVYQVHTILPQKLVYLHDLMDLPAGYGTAEEQMKMATIVADLVRVQGRGHLLKLKMKFQLIGSRQEGC